jgi:uncharacterized protein YgiM (DUF1202 family)
MKRIKLNDWKISVMAVVAMAATGVSSGPSADAQPKPTLIGQCRAAKQSMAIFKTASATSAVVTTLKPDDKVTLAAETSKDGLIEVSTPSKGFVQTINLKACPGAPKPDDKPTPKPDDKPTPKPDDQGLCRFVVQSQGLVIRKEPSASSAVVGEAPANTRVTLTTSPATAKTDTTGRVWVAISGPQSGWVSNGFGKGVSNLIFCK